MHTVNVRIYIYTYICDCICTKKRPHNKINLNFYMSFGHKEDQSSKKGYEKQGEAL